MKITYHETIGWCVSEKSGSMLLSEFTKRERERRGWSMSHMGLLMEVSHPSYNNFERGRGHSTDIGLKALTALGYDIFILGGEPDEQSAASLR